MFTLKPIIPHIVFKDILLILLREMLEKVEIKIYY